MANDASKSNRKVLLVDDDRFLLDMYTLKFKESGCAVDAIADPAAAIKKLQEGFAPDLILLDVVMPAMDGFEFLEKVRAGNLAKGATIVMLSNQGQQEDIDKAMKLGAAGYIIKASSIPSEVLAKALSIADGGK